MATATDLSRLRKLEDEQQEHSKTSSKLKAYATGAMNAPKIGDKAAWGKLTARSLEALTASAITWPAR